MLEIIKILSALHLFQKSVLPSFTFLIAIYLLHRHIAPPEVPDGQKGEHHRVNKSGE